MSHNLFNRCCHFAYGDTAKMRMALEKCNIYANFAMSATPEVVNRNAATQPYAYSHWLIVERMANHGNSYNCISPLTKGTELRLNL